MGHVKKAIPGGYTGKVGTVLGGKWRARDHQIVEIFQHFSVVNLGLQGKENCHIMTNSPCQNETMPYCMGKCMLVP
jgi:hypothetical protein